MGISIELVISIYGIAVLVAIILFIIYVIKDKLER